MRDLFLVVCQTVGFCSLLASVVVGGALAAGMVRQWWQDRDASARMEAMLAREREDMEVAMLEEWFNRG